MSDASVGSETEYAGHVGHDGASDSDNTERELADDVMAGDEGDETDDDAPLALPRLQPGIVDSDESSDEDAIIAQHVAGMHARLGSHDMGLGALVSVGALSRSSKRVCCRCGQRAYATVEPRTTSRKRLRNALVVRMCPQCRALHHAHPGCLVPFAFCSACSAFHSLRAFWRPGKDTYSSTGKCTAVGGVPPSARLGLPSACRQRHAALERALVADNAGT